jgi:hypothetical protein
MDKGTVVFIPCVFERGGFPSERVFIIRPQSGSELRGVADVRYCYHSDRSPLDYDPPEGREIVGCLLGIVLRSLEDGTVRVHLPDGEVYDLDRTNIEQAREATPAYVPI